MPGIKYIARVLRGVRFEKLNEMLTVVQEKSGQSKLRTFFDILWCAARYGAGYYDYAMFGFYAMNGKQRDTYLTRVRNKKVCELMNEPGYGEIFDNKLVFAEHFADFFQRKILNVETADEAAMADFLSGLDTFFAKPIRGTCGNGIEKLSTANFSSPAAALDYARERQLLMLEEPLQQHPQLSRLHSASVNTLRIVTDRVDDTVHIAYVLIKVGVGGSFCDNSGQGGVFCRVDPEKGCICSVATDDYFHVYTHHPDTGICFEGYALPMVDEAIALVQRAALVVPQIRHVGWDVAITPEGPVLIEGNDYPGVMCQFAPHYPEKRGLWPYYKEILHIK